MVTRANRRFDGIGGHLATYASAATLYEVGFNHFFRGKADGGFGDQVFFQGHASPGIYARAFLEGRLDEAQLDRFRREVGGGLPSYPHPSACRLLGVSHGVDGPRAVDAAYQARFNRYLQDRGIADTSRRHGVVLPATARWTSPRAWPGWRSPAESGSTTSSSWSTATCSGSTARCGETARSSRSSRRFNGAGWNVIKVVWGRSGTTYSPPTPTARSWPR